MDKQAPVNRENLNGIAVTDRTYLVTGGLSGIGLEVATWLVEQGAGRVVLVRCAPDPVALEMIAALRAQGADAGD